MSVKRTKVPARFAVEDRGSEKQIAWVLAMLDYKDLLKSPSFFDAVNAMDAEEYAAYIESIKAKVPDLPRARISDLIAALKVLPNKPKNDSRRQAATPAQSRNGARVEYEEMADDAGKVKRRGRIITDEGDRILAGSYGLPTKGDDRFKNETTFFRVWVGDRGGWNVQMYVSDDLTRVELAHDTKLDVLWGIAQNPEAAAALFGHEFKRCGICGRGLTNDESRDRGIGPVCAGRL